MAIVRTNDQNYTAIAAAIRTRGGTTARLTPAQMPGAILAISGGTAHGYASATIDVASMRFEAGASGSNQSS